jgi:hypothetical protein
MRLLFFIFVFSLLCGFVAAQKNQPHPSKDKAFMLDQASPEQAIQILGKPQSDKIEKIDVLYVDKWIDDKFKKEKYRVLLFDKFEDLGKVRLTFLNEKLVAINFLLEKEVQAAHLSAIYKIKFMPIFSEFGIKDSVGEFDKLTKNVSSAKFPRNYHLVGTSKTSVLTANIFSSEELATGIRTVNTGAQIKTRTKLITGKVIELQILSRMILK